MKPFVAMILVLALTPVFPLPAKTAPPPAPRVQLAILLDTSGSMDGLIDQARTRIWRIVNELARARKNGRAPLLEVALYEYGQNSIPAAEAYLRCVVPLSGDLDRVSEELFKLRTNGGDEYCGRVIEAAVRGLQWSAAGDLKMIVIAGNEPFTQGPVDYRRACREAIGRGIVVNTIFCGSHGEGVATDWKAGADLADGQFVAIDADNAPPPPSAPQDSEIARLGRALNQTYLAFGRQGESLRRRQEAQDANAAASGGAFMAERAAAKAAPQYNNSGWDLVDAEKAGTVHLQDLKDEDLPREMKGMSAGERSRYVDAMRRKRQALQKRISDLSAERERFVRQQMQNGAAAASLDQAIVDALRRQAAAKGFRFAQ